MSLDLPSYVLHSLASPCPGGDDVQVIQKSEYVLVGHHLTGSGGQGVVLGESKQGRHEWAALFSAFSLFDDHLFAVLMVPEES